jgi:hypothetical protein
MGEKVRRPAMRTRASALATVLALAALGGCYIAPDSGGSVQVTASVPRSVVDKPATGYTLRVFA